MYPGVKPVVWRSDAIPQVGLDESMWAHFSILIIGVLCPGADPIRRRVCRVWYWPLEKFDIERPPTPKARRTYQSGVWQEPLVEGPDDMRGTAREIERKKCIELFRREQRISNWNNIVFLMKMYLDKNFRYELVEATSKFGAPCHAPGIRNLCTRERPPYWRGDYLQFRIRPNRSRRRFYLCMNRKGGTKSSVERHWVTVAIKFYYEAKSLRFAFVIDGKERSNIVCQGHTIRNIIHLLYRNVVFILYTTMQSVRLSKYMVIFNSKEKRLSDELMWYESRILGLYYVPVIYQSACQWKK
jgi:hypothetical protein